MPAPIGITYLPTDENTPQSRGQPSDLGQALEILSLRLPRVRGARPISPQVYGQGAGGSGSAWNPYAAIIEAMLTAMQGGQPGQPQGGFSGGQNRPPPPSPVSTTSVGGPPPTIPTPRIRPGIQPPAPDPVGESDQLIDRRPEIRIQQPPAVDRSRPRPGNRLPVEDGGAYQRGPWWNM